ncbi:hypothetical protein EDC96DRAFT_220212, partial [Choanephora cucurbitarum]
MTNRLQLVVNPSLKDVQQNVNSLIQNDQVPFDLNDYLKMSDYSIQHENAFSQSALKPYPKVWFTKIQENAYKIGFLQNIGRVWLSTNNTLYLWDHQTNDCFRYECDDVIQHVDLIDFDQQFELIVSTADFLFSHTIKREGNKLKIASSTMVKTNGVVMNNMVATKDT